MHCPWEEVATWHQCEVEQHWSLKQLWANGLRQEWIRIFLLATVLQTYTAVSLQQVKKDIALWRPPLQDEYNSLSQLTHAIKPTT